MIPRVWLGVTTKALADEFQNYIFATGLPGLESASGNLGVIILRRAEEGTERILLISFWKSLEAISRFARPDITKAQYYPGDEKYLIKMEPVVAHCKVVAGHEFKERSMKTIAEQTEDRHVQVPAARRS